MFINKYEVLIAGAEVHFYFGLIDKGEPKSCNVKVKKEKKKTLGENMVLTLTTLTNFDYY